MRIGSFIFPVSHYPHNDGAVIDSTLEEIELAEGIGLDAVWLTEHHFDGAVAYADPLVFGAAVAARTKRVKIGFAVVELALHHPIRLAVQTATLDNLSHGRLIVGTGRGSAFNHYEYIGFGIDMQDGIDRLDESEELLVKAWTETHLKHEGEHWQVKFPMLRPRPYQKPHPPLIRACISEGSTIAMAKIGRPVMIGILPLEDLASRLNAFRDAMLASGFDEQDDGSHARPVLGVAECVRGGYLRRGARGSRARASPASASTSARRAACSTRAAVRHSKAAAHRPRPKISPCPS